MSARESKLGTNLLRDGCGRRLPSGTSEKCLILASLLTSTRIRPPQPNQLCGIGGYGCEQFVWSTLHRCRSCEWPGPLLDPNFVVLYDGDYTANAPWPPRSPIHLSAFF